MKKVKIHSFRRHELHLQPKYYRLNPTTNDSRAFQSSKIVRLVELRLSRLKIEVERLVARVVKYEPYDLELVFDNSEQFLTKISAHCGRT